MLARDAVIALFERRRDAWLRQDLDGYLALWTADMRFQSPTHREPIDRAAFAALVQRSFELARPVSFDFHRIAIDGDAVLAEWTIAMEARDGGRRIAWRGMSVCTMRDGLIASWREYWNPADLA